MNFCNRDRAATTLLIITLACLIGSSVSAHAQGSQNPAPEKWRPRDGAYFEVGTTFTCENAPFLLELGKKHFIVEERSGCNVTRIADTAPGALRLDMTCNETAGPDEDEGKTYKEVMTLKRIDDASFFMRISKKGKFFRREWRVNYCPENDKSGAR